MLKSAYKVLQINSKKLRKSQQVNLHASHAQFSIHKSEPSTQKQ